MITNKDVMDALAREIAGRKDRPVKAIIHDNRSKSRRESEKSAVPYNRVLDAGKALDWVRQMGNELAYLTVWGKKFVYLTDEDTEWGYVEIRCAPIAPRKYTRWDV